MCEDSKGVWLGKNGERDSFNIMQIGKNLAFFDVIVHLVVHLFCEALLGGLVTFQWMYPIKRNLGTYKKYMTNKAQLKGSIAEAYIIDEAIIFCLMYFYEM